MKRIGFGLTGESTRLLSIRDLIPYVQKAEKCGFESVWMAEDYFYRNAILSLATFALATDKIKLATGIINPYTRDPALIAMTFANLDEISQKRAIIGLGSSLRLRIYEHHYRKVSNLTAMKECIEIISELLRGKKVTYAGSVFKIENIRLGVKPPRANIPIYIGAMGPKMLQLAGEIADGVLLTAGTTREYVRFAVENIKNGAKRTGRKPEDVDVASFVIFSVSEDPRVAEENIKREIAFLVTLPAMDHVLRASYLLDTENVRTIRRLGQKGEMGKAAEHVSEDLTNSLAVCGRPQECLEKLEELRSSGLKLPIIVPIGKKDNLKMALDLFAK